MKKPSRSSNLALRFYKSDGWEKKELDECCIKGKIICAHPEDIDPYYTLDIGSTFDVKKLIEKMSVLHRRFDDYPEQTDEQFIEKMNWDQR